MEDKLLKLQEEVKDEESFIDFLCALKEDREDEVEKEKKNPSSPYGPGANGWDNGTIEAFLDASCRWALSTKNGTKYYKKPENPWKRVADIIYMGKIYE